MTTAQELLVTDHQKIGKRNLIPSCFDKCKTSSYHIHTPVYIYAEGPL